MAISRSEARHAELARRIIGLAAQYRWTAGRHVTEAELCRTLKISRTPVRSALRLLQAARVVDARPGRGFYLLIDGTDAARQPTPIELTEHEALYTAILQDRIANTLSGDVTRSLLLARYGSSRAVMETVLSRLVDDGLLERGAGRRLSFAASVSDETNIRASYELRLAVEPAALRLPDFRADPDVLLTLRDRHAAMRDQLDRGQPAASGQLVALDADFHVALGDCCGNPFMAAVIRQQTNLRRLLEYTANKNVGRVQMWLEEHLDVLDAIAAGNLVHASTTLQRHLEVALHASMRSEAAVRPPSGG